MLRIGYHLSIALSLDMAFDRAVKVGCTAMQIFNSNPRGWEVKFPSDGTVREFRKKAEESGIETVTHMPYLPNLASGKSSPFYKKSLDSLAKNIELCGLLGIPYLITHLGSHMGKGKEKGLESVVDILDSVSDSASEVSILLENQAGHANSIGADVSDLRYIYDNSSLSEKGRLGFCLDTCHLFAAGYDLADEKVLDRIDDVLGFEKVHAFHMNDAKFPLGSNKDRHENIGKGFIGIRGFRTMMTYGKISGKILILETPYETEIPDGSEMRTLIKLAGE